MAVKCKSCENIFLPPKPRCPRCGSNDLSWVPVNGSGRLLTYTVIYVVSEMFEKYVPYAVGIIGLDGGLRLPGIILEVPEKRLKVGLKLKVKFSSKMPSGYYFTLE